MNTFDSFNYNTGKPCLNSPVRPCLASRHPESYQMQVFPFRDEVVKGSEGKKGFGKYALSQHDSEQRDSNISQLGFDQHFSKTEPSEQLVLGRETEEAFVSYLAHLARKSEGRTDAGSPSSSFPVCKAAQGFMWFRDEGLERGREGVAPSRRSQLEVPGEKENGSTDSTAEGGKPASILEIKASFR